MLIAEKLALLALQQRTGETRSGAERALSAPAIAAALLLELAVQTRVGLRDGWVVLLDDLPSRHRLLTKSLRLLHDHNGTLRTDAAIAMLTRGLRHPEIDLLEGLVARDILHPPTRRFRWFGRRFWRVRSLQAQAEALDGLHAAAVGNRNTLQDVALLAVAVSGGVGKLLLTAEEFAEACERLDLLKAEIDSDLRSHAELLDEHYSIALMAEISRSLDKHFALA